jgi:broad specificity phosphatase PhoE
MAEQMGGQKWPATIWIVRHGQSAGNVARDAAEAAALPWIDVSTRDMDTPLSPLGKQQSHALAEWFTKLPADERPTAILTSPYVRSRQTAEAVFSHMCEGGDDPIFRLDERIREKEFGILDRLTKFGIREKYPELAEQRAHVGKFYFRPPGGESWCDVILRLRSIIDTLTRDYRNERVLIVAHQVIVNCFRYLLERLDEPEILAIDKQLDVPNCSVTSYEYDSSIGKNGKLVLRLSNFTAPVVETGTPVTSAPDAPTAKSAGA